LVRDRLYLAPYGGDRVESPGLLVLLALQALLHGLAQHRHGLAGLLGGRAGLLRTGLAGIGELAFKRLLQRFDLLLQTIDIS
jgi:hypothetical protein